MWNEPTIEELNKLPKIAEVEYQDIKDVPIYMHFFFGGCDWYIAEFDGTDLLYGFAILHNDFQNAEWGYSSFAEMKELNVGWLELDRDLHWEVRPSGKVQRIIEACNWQTEERTES